MRIPPGIKFGLWAALTLIGLSWINFYATKSMSPMVTQIGSVIAIVLSSLWMIRLVRYKRDVAGDGSITFWGSFFTSMQVGVIQAVGMIVSTVVFMAVNSSQYKDWSSVDLEQGRQAVVMRPGEQGIIMFLIVMVISTVVALILSIVMHRGSDTKPPA